VPPKPTNKKIRVAIPERTAARVLYGSHHTCVVCNVAGRSVQLHHINEDPADNREANLVVLCLECHDSTQIRGGFGRKLNAPLVTKCKREWLKRVVARRQRADEIATSQMAGAVFQTQTDPRVKPLIAVHSEPAKDGRGDRPMASSLLPYVASLPENLAAAYALARPRWDDGSCAELRQATYEVIDVVEQMLVHLAAWCGPKHFGNMPPREFFSQHVSARFLWHRGLAETAYAGTMTVDLTLGSVLSDVEEDVVRLVEALIGEAHSEALIEWRTKWYAAKKPPEPEAAGSP
jgi:hypothetical protein